MCRDAGIKPNGQWMRYLDFATRQDFSDHTMLAVVLSQRPIAGQVLQFHVCPRAGETHTRVVTNGEAPIEHGREMVMSRVYNPVAYGYESGQR